MHIERLLLRPAEFGDAIGVSRAKAYELIAARVVRSIKVGKSTRVPVDEVRKWVAAELEKQSAGTTEAA